MPTPAQNILNQIGAGGPTVGATPALSPAANILNQIGIGSGLTPVKTPPPKPSFFGSVASEVGHNIGQAFGQGGVLGPAIQLAGVLPHPSFSAGPGGERFTPSDWATLGKNLAVHAGEYGAGAGAALGLFFYHLATKPVPTIRGVPGSAGRAVHGIVSGLDQTVGPPVSYLKHIGRAGLYQVEGNGAAAAKEMIAARQIRAAYNRTVKNEPLMPAITLATLASFGGARLIALANLPDDATGLEVLNALARGTEPGVSGITVRATGEPGSEVLVRTLPANAYRAARMRRMDALLKSLAPNTSRLGEPARAARAAQTEADRTRLRILAEPDVQRYRLQYHRLGKWQRAVAQWKPRLPDQADLDRYVAMLRRDAAAGGKNAATQRQMADLLDNPKFREQYFDADPSSRLNKVIELGRDIAAYRESILLETGHDVMELAWSATRHTRVARGAQYGDEIHGIVDETTQTGAHVRRAGNKQAGTLIGVTPGEKPAPRIQPPPLAEPPPPPEKVPVYAPDTLFHGSPEGTMTPKLVFPHSRQSYREGSGFYLTPDLAKAGKYANGKTASVGRRMNGSGAITPLRLKPGTNVLDLDNAPDEFWINLAKRVSGDPTITPAVWRAAARDVDPRDVRGASPGVINLQRLRVFLGIHAGMTANEAYYAVEDAIARDYHATLHHEGPAPVYVVKDASVLEPVKPIGFEPGVEPPAPIAPVRQHPPLEDPAATVAPYGKDIERGVSLAGARNGTPGWVTLRDGSRHEVDNRHPFSIDGQGVQTADGHTIPIGNVTAVHDGNGDLLASTITAVPPRGAVAQIWYPATQFGGPRSSFAPAAEVQHFTPDTLYGGGDPADIYRDFKARGIMQPYYMPDELHAEPSLKGTGKPTGMGPPQSDIRAWTGALMRAGTLAMRPDTLSASVVRAATEASGYALWKSTIGIARRTEKGVPLEAGWRWVRTVRGEHIPFGETYGAEHYTNTAQEFPELGTSELEITTLDPDEAYTDPRGFRYSVPDSYAQALRAEQRASRKLPAKFWHNATSVWRSLVLHLRIPWLENNIIGNHIMAALRFAGIAGLRAYVDALAEVRGVKAVRELIGLSRTWGMSDEEMRAIFAEHTHHGTFFGTQLPHGMTRNLPVGTQQALRVPGAILGALPHLDRATEGFLRRVGVNTQLRRSPEVVRAYKEMPRETRTWAAALQKAERTHGAGAKAITNAVSRDVNDALGNFLSLTYDEQHMIRSVIPFYAWYREISRIAAKLPLDAPGRTMILLQLGKMQPIMPYPSYLQGDFPTGKPDAQGQQTLVAMRGMWPFSTVQDLGNAISNVLIHHTRAGAFATSGFANPFFALIADQVSKANAGDPKAKTLIRSLWEDTVLGLPEVKPITQKPSALYPGRTTSDVIKQFIGDPYRHGFDPSVAADYYSVGQ